MERTNKGKEVVDEHPECPPPDPNYVVPLQQHGPNPHINVHVPDPRLIDVYRGARLDIGDFNNDRSPEGLDLESFFRWYELVDKLQFFFLE